MAKRIEHKAEGGVQSAPGSGQPADGSPKNPQSAIRNPQFETSAERTGDGGRETGPVLGRRSPVHEPADGSPKNPQSEIRNPQSEASGQQAAGSEQQAASSPENPQSALRNPQSKGSGQPADGSPKNPQSAIRNPQSKGSGQRAASSPENPQSAIRNPQSNKRLRFLHLEDNRRDAELAGVILAAEGIDCAIDWVESRDQFIAALESGGYDLVLADYTLPDFDGLAALKMVREKCPDVPFIFVTGTLGEEVAVEAVKDGATDYVLKHHLKRLGAGVGRALREAEERRSRREAEEKFRQIAENIREVFWMSNPSNSEMIYISPAYEAIWGRSREDLYRAPRSWLDAIHPEDRERVAHASQTDEVSGKYDESYRIVRPDGSVRWIRDRGFPVRDPAGKVYRIVGIAEDMTERKLAEEAREAHQRKIEMLHELSQKILGTLDLQKVLDEFLHQAMKVESFDIGVIWLLDAKTNSLEVKATAGYRDRNNIEYLTMDLNQPRIGVNLSRLVSEKETIIADRVRESPGWGSFKREGAESAIMLPIHGEGRLLGVIQLGRRKQREFQRSEIAFLQTLVGQAATAIQKAELYEETQRSLDRIRALNQINLAITSSLDLRSRLHALLEKIELFVPVAAASTIRLLHQQTGTLGSVACRGIDEDLWKAQVPATLQNRASRIVSTKAPVTVRDIRIGAREGDILVNSGLISYLGVPLMSHGQVLGVLSLYTAEEHEFRAEEIDFLMSLANQAAIAIRDAELYERAERQSAELAERERIQRALKELSQDITTMDVERLMEKLTATIRELFKVEVADVRFLGKERWEKVLVSTDDGLEWVPQGAEFGQGANVWVVKQRRSIAIRDYTQQSEFSPGRVARRFGARGFLAAPLIGKQGEVFGVMRALSKTPRDFTRQEIELFEQMANGAAIAIANSRLYTELQRSSKVKDEFLSVTSHELRTPLNVIMGYAELARHDLKNGRALPLQAVETIDAQARMMLGMINRLMEATQIQAGAVVIVKQPVDLGALFEDLKEKRPAPSKKDLIITWPAPAGLPALTTDPEKLNRILEILIDNAIKFTPAGGEVCVTCQVSRVKSEAPDPKPDTWNMTRDTRQPAGSPQKADGSPDNPQSALRTPQSEASGQPAAGSEQQAASGPENPHSALRNPQSEASGQQAASSPKNPQSAIRNPQSEEREPETYVEFSVADTGVGIAAEDLPGIFEMFKQADSSDTRSFEGMGLGLYIAKKYTELLGGEIEVESEVGKGSTFTARLPAG
jgi:PAS domain S-box-containing protein